MDQGEDEASIPDDALLLQRDEQDVVQNAPLQQKNLNAPIPRSSSNNQFPELSGNRLPNLSPNREISSSSLNFFVSKVAKKSLNVLVAGEAGLGKSTFINVFFKKEIMEPGILLNATEAITITKTTLESPNYIVQLTLIDTPGYGDKSTVGETAEPVLKLLRGRMDDHLRLIQNTGIPSDNLVHCCFFFLAPHRLKRMDLEYMRLLAPYVNLIPIVGKGDSMTLREKSHYCQLVHEQLVNHQIPYFGFPNSREVFAEAGIDHELPPFVVIGSDQLHPQYGPCREYAWGHAMAENSHHCDLPVLRRALLSGADFDHLQQSTLQLYKTYIMQKNSNSEPLCKLL